MLPTGSSTRIVVTGDFTIDWYLARIRASEREGSLGDPLFETGAFRQPGGALLLGKLIQQIAQYLKIKPSVLTNDLPKQDSPMLGGYWHSFTIFAEFLGIQKKTSGRWPGASKSFSGSENSRIPVAPSLKRKRFRNRTTRQKQTLSLSIFLEGKTSQVTRTYGLNRLSKTHPAGFY